MLYRLLLVSSVLFYLGIWCAKAQVSEGGFPLKVSTLKSAVSNKISMPALPKNAAVYSQEDIDAFNGGLKSLRFAHSFEVALSTENSGKWYTTSAGFNVWILNIESKNAKSLNLIFDRFELPEGARLFLYSEKEDKYLGAFTATNNKSFAKFAVMPVSGDEITVQYEVPEKLGAPNSFEIARVNHDFIGITKSDRRPLGKAAGSCNVDINCDIGDKYSKLKNSICRLIVNGKELCSGTLVNNTAEDKKPYIMSAAHCYDDWDWAETTIFAFNYESPYCAPLDGDPGHTISGAVMKAHFDSLDFALAEMSLVPPPEFRPYYAGWDHSDDLTDTVLSIHHPQGDVKKVSFYYSEPQHSSFGKKYTTNGFLNISEWDVGVTEVGSSGGALFNSKQQLVGTLTGGTASCANPVNDYYSRFDMCWNYRSDSTKQVAHWLDPLKSGAQKMDGKQFNTGEDRCKAFTNLIDSDDHANISLTSGGSFAGYWGGTNDVGITEVVERFSIAGNESLLGVSFGIGKIVTNAEGANSVVRIKVYEGEEAPQSLLYSQLVNIKDLTAEAMNYISFTQDVQPEGNVFVGFELHDMQTQDTIVMYQSLRSAGANNSFYFKRNGEWSSFASASEQAMANVMELVACNYKDLTTDTPIVNIPANVKVYPNPAQSEVTVESDQVITIETLSVFNLLGQEINVPLINVDDHRVKFDLSGNEPGIYMVRFNYDDTFVTRRISFISRE